MDGELENNFVVCVFILYSFLSTRRAKKPLFVFLFFFFFFGGGGGGGIPEI